jgi:hypothetical protein
VFTNDPSCSKPNTFAVIVGRIATQICPANRTHAWSRSTKCTAFPNAFAAAKANLPNSDAWQTEDACSGNMLVLIRRQDRDAAVPVSQLTAANPDESTRRRLCGQT